MLEATTTQRHITHDEHIERIRRYDFTQISSTASTSVHVICTRYPSMAEKEMPHALDRAISMAQANPGDDTSYTHRLNWWFRMLCDNIRRGGIATAVPQLINVLKLLEVRQISDSALCAVARALGACAKSGSINGDMAAEALTSAVTFFGNYQNFPKIGRQMADKLKRNQEK